MNAGAACGCGKAGPRALFRCAVDFRRWAASLGLPKKSMERLAGAWRPVKYAPGSAVFYQDHEPLGVYFLRSGSVKLVRCEGTGRQRIVRVVSAPSVLGERALIAGQAYAATGWILDEACICAVSAERFREIWALDPELARFFARLLAVRLGVSDEAGTDLALRTIRERIAKLIVKLSASETGPEATVTLRMSRQDIAEVMGTSPEAVCRAFSDLSSKKIVSAQGRMVRILDRERLRAAAGLTFINRPAAFCHVRPRAD